MRLLDNNNLAKKINEEWLLVKNQIEEKYWIDLYQFVFFISPNNHSLPGVYVYSDGYKYHMDMVGDRGGIVSREVYEDVTEISYTVIWGLASDISTSYACDHKIEGQDWRRVMFAYRLQLLKFISDKYYLLGIKKIDSILRKNPYTDIL